MRLDSADAVTLQIDAVLRPLLMKDLRAQCRVRGLTPAGGADVLRQRLKDHMKETMDFSIAADAEGDRDQAAGGGMPPRSAGGPPPPQRAAISQIHWGNERSDYGTSAGSVGAPPSGQPYAPYNAPPGGAMDYGYPGAAGVESAAQRLAHMGLAPSDAPAAVAGRPPQQREAFSFGDYKSDYQPSSAAYNAGTPSGGGYASSQAGDLGLGAPPALGAPPKFGRRNSFSNNGNNSADVNGNGGGMGAIMNMGVAFDGAPGGRGPAARNGGPEMPPQPANEHRVAAGRPPTGNEPFSFGSYNHFRDDGAAPGGAAGAPMRQQSPSGRRAQQNGAGTLSFGDYDYFKDKDNAGPQKPGSKHPGVATPDMMAGVAAEAAHYPRGSSREREGAAPYGGIPPPPSSYGGASTPKGRGAGAGSQISFGDHMLPVNMGGAPPAAAQQSRAVDDAGRMDPNVIAADTVIRGLTIKDLRVQCRARGITPAGGAEALKDRLKEAMLATGDFSLKADVTLPGSPAQGGGAPEGDKWRVNNYARPGGQQNVGNHITDRPSSRVLAPPGGVSQICFGDAAPSPPPPQRMPAQDYYSGPPQYQSPPPQYGAPQQYGAPPPQYGAPPPQYAPQQYGAPPPQQYQQSPVQGGGFGASSDSVAHGRLANNYARPGGQQNVGNMLTDRPTSRVLAPPGGRSQITFG